MVLAIGGQMRPGGARTRELGGRRPSLFMRSALIGPASSSAIEYSSIANRFRAHPARARAMDDAAVRVVSSPHQRDPEP